MKITSFEIKNLFNAFSYEIDATAFGDDNTVRILTGPNGYGKTTIIEIIENLAKCNLLYFFTFSFDRIKIAFDNKAEIVVVAKKTNQSDENNDSVPALLNDVEFSYKIPKKETFTLCLSYQCLKSLFTPRDLRNMGFEEKVDHLSFSDIRFLISPECKYKYEFDIKDELFQSLQSETSQFLVALKGIKTHYIPVSRLYTFTQEQDDDDERKVWRSRRFFDFGMVSSISEISKNLKKRLAMARNEYLENAQKLDNSFIDRVVDSSNENSYTREKYVEKREELNKKIKEISSYGLIENVKLHDFDEEHKAVLSAYINDFGEKIKKYDEIVGKLNSFSQIIEEKKFPIKKIGLSPESGLRFKSDADSSFIDLEALSSGEKNEIIMLYHLIFEIEDESILLIDEPEISLHVAWQSDFIKDIEKIAKAKNLQVVVATHSPQIVNENWDICYDLYGHTKQPE